MRIDKQIKFIKFAVTLTLLLTIILPLTLQAQAEKDTCSIAGGKIKIPCPLKGEKGPAGGETFGSVVQTILNVALALVGSIAVIFLVVGGYRYITAYGNEEATEGAKKMMTQAILGLAIVVLAFAIITVVTRLVIQGRGGAF